MDSLTQAVLGAATYTAIMGKHQGRKALLVGAALGTLPDLDVLIPYADPISQMTYHRGWSHSLLLLTALAWAFAWLWCWYKQPPYATKRLGVAVWLALITHPLIDAMTIYGTQLWYPFKVAPTSWATVFVIDPIYTLPMLIACLAYAVRPKKTEALWATIGFGVLYFGWGFLGKAVHEHRVEKYLAKQGITVTRIISNPTPFNTILWRVLAEDDKGNYHEAFSGWLDKRPPEVRSFRKNQGFAKGIWEKAPLLQRLDWFTDGWLAYTLENDEEIVAHDVRMSYAGVPIGFEFIVGLDHRDHYHIVTPKRLVEKPKLPANWRETLGQRILGKGSVFEP